MSHKRRILTVSAIAIALAWVVGVSADQPEYLLGPQDEVTVTVWGRPELSGKFVIDSEGAVKLPLIERVKVSGLTVHAMEEALRKSLAEGYLKNPQVTVAVDVYRSQHVFIQGEVRQPGRYPLSGTTTLLDILTRAGSITPEAGNEVLIIRQPSGLPTVVNPAAPPGNVQRVDLTALQRGSITLNVSLRDGDTIVVPPGIKVYISGQVTTPGAYTIRNETTVLQALTLAGGVTDRGAMSRVKILRPVAGKQKSISVKLDDLVEPGDTIVVPERYF